MVDEGFLPQEVIRRKRDGAELAPAQIDAFVAGITDGSIGDAQVGAFAMAVYFRGMNVPERVALTRAMVRSGETLDWRALGIDGPVVDKHSTGGVGDKVSLVLAPLVAACGACVPMISGRGLGHTGGTLDKLESIPGYDIAPSRQGFADAVRQAGCAIIGQTADLAPADRRLYAIRDVTATVESIPLITASILSKKLAAGLDALVMDVKFGSGAFMVELAAARELARSIARVASDAGTPTTALLSDMSQVLGRSVGNAVEVREAVALLGGREQDARLREVTLALAAEMLALGGLADDVDDGRAMAERALDDGRAAETFARMVATLGGPVDLLERPDHHLPRAPVTRPVPAARGGVVGSIDTRAIGVVVLGLGGGRRRHDAAIDHSVGLTEVAAAGAEVDAGQPLARVHAANEADAERAVAAVRDAVVVGDDAPAVTAVIHERITS